MLCPVYTVLLCILKSAFQLLQFIYANTDPVFRTDSYIRLLSLPSVLENFMFLFFDCYLMNMYSVTHIVCSVGFD
jgi:hypothetical protein